MPNCTTIDPLVTPYVDGQLSDADRQAVDRHLQACPPCFSRVNAERAVRELIHARKSALASPCASAALRERCAEAARLKPRATETPRATATAPEDVARGFSRAIPNDGARRVSRATPTSWRARLAPFAVAATLVFIVGAAFLYQLTASSARVMAAELAADHMKCFALNGVLHTHDDAAAVESSMLSGFGWSMQLPAQAAKAGLELVGSRPCLYGEGKIAHIMYRHNGDPVSLFMLPKTERAQEIVQVLGHKAAIWCAGNRTFVLVAREPKEDVERMAALVRSSLR